MKPQTSDMTPQLYALWLLFDAAMKAAGIAYVLNCVLRTRAEQAAFVAQGRTVKEMLAMFKKAGWNLNYAKVLKLSETMDAKAICNQLRADAGMSLNPNWGIVTKTLNSRHFGNKEGKSSAFDIYLLKDGKTATWDIKWDKDRDGIPEYIEAAKIGQSVGLSAGGLWTGTFKDYPHYEVPGVK